MTSTQHAEGWKVAQEAELKFWQAYLGGIPQDRAQFVKDRLYEGQVRIQQFDLETIEGRLLDVGCSPISVHEGREGLDIVAIDPLLDRLPSGFATLGKVANVEYRCCEVYDVQDGPYDVIWCVNVLDHTDDWRAMIKEFARLTATRGLLLLGLDVRCGVPSDSPCHISSISPQEVVDEVWKVGFAVDFSAPVSPDPKYYFRVRAHR